MEASPALITLERAWSAIGLDDLRRLRRCHQAGWADWQAIRATKAGSGLSPTARAQIVHDGAIAYAKDYFPESIWRDLQGLFALDLGELLVRFKKLDADLTPHGIPTGQAVLFEDQAQMLEAIQLTLWAPLPMVIVGYVLDEFGLSIERHVIVLRRDGVVIWSRDLPDSDEGEAPIPLLVGPPSAPNFPEVRSTRPVDKENEDAQ